MYFSLMLGRVMLTCDSFALVGWTSTPKGGSGLMTGLVGVTIPATLDAPASSAMRHRQTTYRQPTDNLQTTYDE